METLRHLPSPPSKRLAIHVKPAAERALRQGHPWVFDESITKQNAEGAAGSLAIIFDRKKDKFLGSRPVRPLLAHPHQSIAIQ